MKQGDIVVLDGEYWDVEEFRSNDTKALLVSVFEGEKAVINVKDYEAVRRIYEKKKNPKSG